MQYFQFSEDAFHIQMIFCFSFKAVRKLSCETTKQDFVNFRKCLLGFKWLPV